MGKEKAIWWIIFMVLLLGIRDVSAQQESAASRFSHRGIKGVIAAGSLEANSERELDEGDLGLLGIGYGFSDRFSLWLNLLGVDHPVKNAGSAPASMAGVELVMQHKFVTQSRLQPYGKVGVGLYGLEETNSDVTLFGGGFNFGLGMDFFFAKHFGIGAELIFKKFDYSHKRTKVEGGDLVTKLEQELDGDSAGLMFTLTIQ